MNYKKILQKEMPEQSRELVEFIDDTLLCDLLVLRGINSKEEASEFLNSVNCKLETLDVFCDAQKATERIKKAINNKEKILVWGDFDADGVTSSALMHNVFKRLKANFEIFIPDREEHGHGINSKKALELISKHKVKVLLTVDCGISNVKEIKLLKSLGVDVIITDHHKLDGETPDAYAIINPQAPNSLRDDLGLRQIESLCNLAGVGVAYKLGLKLLNKNEDNELLPLACVGTISDVVPLTGENRTIVTKGLNLINQNQHKGITMLFKNNCRNNITSSDIAFILTPRINAVGRLSTPELAFNFLIEENENSLNFILEKMENFNKIRQSLCEQIYIEASQMAKDSINDSAIILYNKDWHLGIIGIVASKILEDYYKPVFMMTSDENNIGRCSVRSIKNFNVYEILKSNSELFLGYGGHSLAGGFSFDMNLHSFEEIKGRILDTINEMNPDIQEEKIIEVDKFINAKDINKELINKINLLEPFGQNNPAPLFGLQSAILKDIRVIGKNSNHLKLICQKDDIDFECVKWNENSFAIPQNSNLDIAFSPKLNFYNNEENIQLEIVDAYSNAYAKKESEQVKIYDHRKKDDIYSQICDYLKKDGLDITIWAKNIRTLEKLKKYPEIQSKYYNKKSRHKSMMFFDYPSSYDELERILKEIKPSKIHLMNNSCDESIENTFKILSGMLKYAHNHKKGKIDITTLANACGVSDTFIQLALEIFENIGTIEIMDIDKIRYIEPVNFAKLTKETLYEIIKEEFLKITEFKKHLVEDDLDKMYKLVSLCLK